MFFVINTDKCINCGLCQKTCKSKANIIQKGKDGNLKINILFNVLSSDERHMVRTGKYCAKCFDCMAICPTNAIFSLLDLQSNEEIRSIIVRVTETLDERNPDVSSKISCSTSDLFDVLGI